MSPRLQHTETIGFRQEVVRLQAMLKAAMTVATIASRRPAHLLSRLNTVLAGRGGAGFTTCCAALFETNGRVAIADAGYSETALTLTPGDRVAFVSDGVIEARSAAGELYGFDRMRDLSARTAAEIAETARKFGQQDDISVITVQCAIKEATYAA